MTGYLAEMIIVSLLASAVLFGVLELLWGLWEGGKPGAGNHTE